MSPSKSKVSILVGQDRENEKDDWRQKQQNEKK
jgi:hypothetical protein